MTNRLELASKIRFEPNPAGGWDVSYHPDIEPDLQSTDSSRALPDRGSNKSRRNKQRPDRNHNSHQP